MEPNPEQLAQWAQEAVEGDRDAFGRLYQFYLPNLYRFVRFRVRSVEDAEDVTEKIFLKIWEAMPRFQAERAKFSTWMFTIARRTIVDHYRTSKETEELHEHSAVADWGHETEQQLDRNTQLEQVVDAVRQLPQLQAEVLALRFFSDLSITETARAMRKTEVAVRVLQHRALKRLKVELPNKEIDL